MPRTVLLFHSALNPDAVSETLLRSLDGGLYSVDLMPWYVRLLWRARSRKVRGRVEQNTFRLRKWNAWQLSPCFYGKWEPQYGGTRIEGYFDLDPAARFGARITLAVLLGFAAIGITLNGLDLKVGTHFTVDPQIGLALSILFVPFTLGMYFIARALGFRRDKRLVEFVERTLVATAGLPPDRSTPD